MRRDEIGEGGEQEQNRDDDEARDRAMVGAEIGPEFAQRLRGRTGLRVRDRRVDDVDGHRVCRMRGLIRP